MRNMGDDTSTGSNQFDLRKVWLPVPVQHSVCLILSLSKDACLLMQSSAPHRPTNPSSPIPQG